MASPPDTAPAPKSRLVPVLIAVLITAVLGGGVFTQQDRIRQMMGDVPTAVAATEVPIEFGEVREMEGIVINPRGSNGRRYLMAKLGVEAAKVETLDRLDALSPIARDGVLDVLAALTAEELSDINRRDSLKLEVAAVLNEILGKDGPVTRVYFTQFVLQ